MTVHEAVVVGTGFGGLAAAIELQRNGIDDVVLLEKADSLGGTWRDNRYPGCACDIPSHLYSFSFAPSARWSRAYAEQPEIWDYLRRVADEFGVARTDPVRRGARRSHVRRRCVAPAHRPRQRLSRRGRWCWPPARSASRSCPHIPGLESFRGNVFHTAQWPDDDTAAIDGRRVAVLGTGASAVQAVPQIAPARSAPDGAAAHAVVDHPQGRPEIAGDEQERLRAQAVALPPGSRRHLLAQRVSCSGVHLEAAVDEGCSS